MWSWFYISCSTGTSFANFASSSSECVSKVSRTIQKHKLVHDGGHVFSLENSVYTCLILNIIEFNYKIYDDHYRAGALHRGRTQCEIHPVLIIWDRLCICESGWDLSQGSYVKDMNDIQAINPFITDGIPQYFIQNFDYWADEICVYVITYWRYAGLYFFWFVWFLWWSGKLTD